MVVLSDNNQTKPNQTNRRDYGVLLVHVPKHTKLYVGIKKSTLQFNPIRPNHTHLHPHYQLNSIPPPLLPTIFFIRIYYHTFSNWNYSIEHPSILPLARFAGSATNFRHVDLFVALFDIIVIFQSHRVQETACIPSFS